HAATALNAAVNAVYTYDIDDWDVFQSDGIAITGPTSTLTAMSARPSSAKPSPSRSSTPPASSCATCSRCWASPRRRRCNGPASVDRKSVVEGKRGETVARLLHEVNHQKEKVTVVLEGGQTIENRQTTT